MLGDIAHRLLTPSVRDGTAALRALVGGAPLCLAESGWRFDQPSVSQVWFTIPLWNWRMSLKDSTVEWMLEGGFARRLERGARVVVTDRGRQLLARLDGAVGGVVLDMSTLPVHRLRSVIADLRADSPDADYFVLAQLLSQWVLLVLFGTEWFDTHVKAESAPTNFFRSGATDDAGRTLGMLRVVQLAEMIFNMQHVEGIEKSKQLIADGDVESGFAELEVGKLLHVNSKKFRFITPRGVRGDDYDLEIDCGGETAYAETKCKIETTEISEETVMNSLGDARKQLPKSGPGTIFVKVPQAWNTSEESFALFLKQVTTAFFRTTQRIVSVKYHSSLLVDTGTTWSPRVVFMEIPNPVHRFSTTTNWDVFGPMTQWPDHWVNFLDQCAGEN